MSNLYTKAYGKTLEPVSEFDSPEEALANYFKGAAKYMDKAVAYHHEGAIEERLRHCEKAMFILGTVLGIFEKAPEAERSALIPLMDFLVASLELIKRMNIKGSAFEGELIAKQLHQTANLWEARAQDSSTSSNPPSAQGYTTGNAQEGLSIRT